MNLENTVLTLLLTGTYTTADSMVASPAIHWTYGRHQVARQIIHFIATGRAHVTPEGLLELTAHGRRQFLSGQFLSVTSYTDLGDGLDASLTAEFVDADLGWDHACDEAAHPAVTAVLIEADGRVLLYGSETIGWGALRSPVAVDTIGAF